IFFGQVRIRNNQRPDVGGHVTGLGRGVVNLRGRLAVLNGFHVDGGNGVLFGVGLDQVHGGNVNRRLAGVSPVQQVFGGVQVLEEFRNAGQLVGVGHFGGNHQNVGAAGGGKVVAEGGDLGNAQVVAVDFLGGGVEPHTGQGQSGLGSDVIGSLGKAGELGVQAQVG